MHQIEENRPHEKYNFTYSCFLTFTKLDEHQASYGIFFVSENAIHHTNIPPLFNFAMDNSALWLRPQLIVLSVRSQGFLMHSLSLLLQPQELHFSREGVGSARALKSETKSEKFQENQLRSLNTCGFNPSNTLKPWYPLGIYVHKLEIWKNSFFASDSQF